MANQRIPGPLGSHDLHAIDEGTSIRTANFAPGIIGQDFLQIAQHPSSKLRAPRGTIYWGGAGLNGGYVQPQIDAFRKSGIARVWVGLTNTATRIAGGDFGTIIDAIRAGLVIRYEDNSPWTIESGMDQPSEQFNLVGYSYGSLLAAQTANYYAKNGIKVDNLVLIGSPIERDFLFRLRAYRNIGKVTVIDLREHGDPIYAGMSLAELTAGVPQLATDMLANKGEGHFYYGHVVPDSPRRWLDLARKVHASGLR
jgi:pimeloyl-ACP methyl ester carboxylesterase